MMKKLIFHLGYAYLTKFKNFLFMVHRNNGKTSIFQLNIYILNLFKTFKYVYKPCTHPIDYSYMCKYLASFPTSEPKTISMNLE